MSDTQNGLQLVLKANPGPTLPSFEARITNVQNAPIQFCRYQLRHRLLSTLHAEEGYDVRRFGANLRPKLQESDFHTLAPGESLTCAMKFEGEEYEWVWGGSRPPVIEYGNGLKEFPAGTYTFTCHVGDFINLSTAEPGTSGPSERIHILDEIGHEEAPPQACWRGDLVASCQLTVD